MPFTAQLHARILRDLTRVHGADNHDVERFGRLKLKPRVENRINRIAGRGGRGWLKTGRIERFLERIGPELEHLSELYDDLDDEASRELLVELFAFRALGAQHVKLPLNTPEFWRERDRLRGLFTSTETRDANSFGMQLRRCRLHELGFPIEMFAILLGIECVFSLEQYVHEGPRGKIQVEAGDVVIDAGGCWGDTALYFADRAGKAGRVFVYEFIPSNLRILHENIALNPELAERIQVVERPVWDESDLELYFEDQGPASRVFADPDRKRDGSTRTLSIDDLVQREGIERVDFIKMDIEGAETWALRGAQETIRRFQPKLAISVYHQLSDFTGVHRLIKEARDGYRFALGHSTIHEEETVLFAIPR